MTSNISRLGRRGFLAGAAGTAALALAGCSVVQQNTTGGPASGGGSSVIKFGVSAPRTGQLAEYGKYYEQGFAIALDAINNAGGIDGKKIELVWEDSQSDPKQSVPIAQKFVANNEIIAELGDFSSGASMAATPVYEKAKLVQFGFTNSNPAFTAGGTMAWTTSLTQENYQEGYTKLLAKYGKTVAVYYQQTDWGKTSFDLFTKYAGPAGLNVVYSSAFNPETQDFRPVLLRGLEAKPDVIAHLGYGPDGGLLVKQLRSLGFTGKVLAGQTTPQFLEIAGEAAEGVVLAENFTLSDPNPDIQKFITDFRAKFNVDPGAFNVYAYDALQVLAQATKVGGATREGVYKGLSSGESFKTLLLGDLTFNDKRRPNNVILKEIVVEKGEFVSKGTL
ncbi:ABC transporter substrate-binding protein [Propionibacteriaceae bacterium G1746]|uniref:ABC transporter substrate-binding protein n=1 Tax=Aestuariimicrobium sp. G57 TaxID=3418485 RepID=UPI003C25802E